MKRWEAVEALAPAIAGSLVVSCNGMTGRDLWATGDRPDRLYMIGSMGLASSIGMGLALAQPGKRVVVLDGDGNVLMNMGTLANVAVAQPANYYHVLLDNGVHASTGGQRTISRQVRLDEIARTCGYADAKTITTVTEVVPGMEWLFDGPGPRMLRIEVEPGNQPGVPRVEVTPEDMATRFKAAATEG